MRNFLPFAAALLFAAPIALPQQLAAQDQAAPAAEEEDTVYHRLHDQFTADPQGIVAVRTSQIIVDMLLSASPEIAAIQEENPGFRRRLEKELMPTLTRYTVRVRALHRPNFVSRTKAVLTEDEVMQLVTFLDSEIGQTLLATASRSFTVDMTTEELLSDDPFTDEDTLRDMEVSRDAMLAATGPEELAAMERYMRANPVLVGIMIRFRDALIPYRTAMDNEPLNAAEELGIENAIDTAIAAFGY